MNNYIYQDYSMQDRTKMLQKMSSKSHVKTYNRSLSESEIENEKDKFASDAIELDRQKKDLKAQTERLKAGISSVETLMEERLERIKSGQTETTATLYGLPDHSKGVMCWYDSYGECINRTPLTPDEKQGRLFIGEDPEVEILTATQEQPDAPEFDNEGIAEVEFEEAVIDDGTTSPGSDEAYEKAVDNLYAEGGESVDIEQTAPVEDKPKKGSKKPKKQKDELDEDKPF